MNIKEIIKNLEHYNNWRRDNDDKYTMPEPKQIGITIDAAISELNKLLICDVVKSLPTKELMNFDEWLKFLKWEQVGNSYVYKQGNRYKDTNELKQIHNAYLKR